MREGVQESKREGERERERWSLSQSPTSPRAILIGKVRNISYEILNI